MKCLRIMVFTVCALLVFTAVTNHPVSATPTARVLAIFFTADWCGACKVLKPKLNEVKRGFAAQPIFFTEFDLTDDFTREQSTHYASLLGIEPLYKEYEGKERGRTGFVLLIDAATRKPVGQITANLTPTEIRERITGALRAPGAAARTGTAEVNNTKLHYELSGSGPAVVLIHGGFMDSRMWDPQIAEFAKRFTVLRYDVRGAGRSARNYQEPYSSVEDLDTLLGALGIAKAHIVGLSAGGELAVNFVLEKPERVLSLVAAEAGLTGVPFQGEGMEFMRKVLDIATKQGAVAAAEAFVEAPVFASMKASNPSAIPHLKMLLKENAHLLVERRNERRPAPAAATRLQNIKVPMLVMVSQYEGGYAAQVAAHLMEGIPHARKVTIPNSGHMMNMEQPAAFNQAVLEFLGTTTGQSAPRH